VQIDVWSDVVCPWCYIGKRRLEAALSRVDRPVTVVWHSFQLDPNAPRESSANLEEMLAKKYGMSPGQARSMQERVTAVAAEAGLAYRLDRARPENTFDAHRLLQWASSLGQGPALTERLMKAYFVDGERIGDRATLARLAGEIGLDPEEAAKVLADESSHADAVRADVGRARDIGVRGVPFFVVDGRYGISGAQEVAVLEQAIRQALAEVPAPAPGCDDGSRSV
jgi:predicted DsbA family dithiol-disulfide isomerase